MEPDQKNTWRPMSPHEIAAVFETAGFSWWIAGGYCIEHFVGRPLRAHGDIDVLVLHRESASVRSFLADWDCWAADPPGNLRPWAIGEELPESVHDVWCRQTPAGPWRFQLMLDDSDQDSWRSRRCPHVTKPLAELRCARSDIPFLVPEIQLFYKAKSPRSKDLLDFQACLPSLNADQRTWLKESITTGYGHDHEWIKII